jgi:hypothetical protein
VQIRVSTSFLFLFHPFHIGKYVLLEHFSTIFFPNLEYEPGCTVVEMEDIMYLWQMQSVLNDYKYTMFCVKAMVLLSR